jgi:hypothetical protein
MAEETIYEVPQLVTLYCYVNKETDVVEAIMSFDIFGIGKREDKTWKDVKQTDPDLVNYLNSNNYRTFKIDWGKEPIIDADPKDEAAWEHQLVAAWDAGQSLTADDLSKYADEITYEAVPQDPSIAKRNEEDFSG